ncbi:hypothetical protein [Edaphocola flava]|uniref:hypothetical protein n=1 Tax=Edaphocola flava TaxID=2499629 RepID=UPI00100B59B2|nr:hypothetical protein [Edaphocola flava]
MNWEKIFIRILNGEQDIPSPYSKDGILKTLFVIVDKETNLGYLLIWCSVTHKAVQLSRMKVPQNTKLNSVYSDEIKKMDVINYELQDIGVFTSEMEANMRR